MNCHSRPPLACDSASGCIALSTNGSSASSIGMPRFSISSTMWEQIETGAAAHGARVIGLPEYQRVDCTANVVVSPQLEATPDAFPQVDFRHGCLHYLRRRRRAGATRVKAGRCLPAVERGAIRSINCSMSSPPPLCLCTPSVAQQFCPGAIAPAVVLSATCRVDGGLCSAANAGAIANGDSSC